MMSKLAHSNEETMLEIERRAREQDDYPDEPAAPRSGGYPCTCTLVGNSFDNPLEYETDEHCPLHGRAIAPSPATGARNMTSSSDLVKRLRNRAEWITEEAADRIEALEAAAAQPSDTNYDSSELQSWIKDRAKPDCGDCNGTGIRHGYHDDAGLCDCVNSQEATK